MIKEKSENKVGDTSHNAISVGEVGQELYLLTKSLYFPPNYLRIFSNNPPIFLRKVNFFGLRILENRRIRTLGLMEAFMKNLGKIWHTSITDNKDPYMERNKHPRVTVKSVIR